MAYNPKLGLDPTPGPARVFVLSGDALAADALRSALLGDPQLEPVAQVDDAQVIVWDLGPDAAAPLSQFDASLTRAAARKQSLVALVADELAGARALQAGALGVVHRRAAATAIRAAVLAVRAGLCVLDARVAEHVLTLPALAPDDDAIDSLTTREREVLQLLALGLANKAIATRLQVSVHTVKFHVNAILSKLDVDSRTAAVATALRRGLVTT